jgi:hypothetical protein
MKKSLVIFLLLAGVMPFLPSCLDLDTGIDTLADAYICSKIAGEDTVYILVGYVSSKATMKSATLITPDGSESIDLKISDYYGYYYERTFQDDDYTSQRPEAGNYQFEIVYTDGTTCDTTNYVSSDILKPTNITDVTTNLDEQSVMVSWEKNSSADYYVVRFFKNDTIIYVSNKIDAGYTSMTIYTYSSGWSSNVSLQSGDSLDVEISGILLESSYSQYAQIQSASFSKKVGLVWPQ